LLAFTFAGALVGLLSSAIILLFRLLIDSRELINLLAGLTHPPSWWFAARLAVGAALLWGIYSLLKTDSRRAGVAHLIERLAQPIARLPLVNMIGQFFGAAVAIAAGFSVGREGPGVHLGAAAGSQLGLYLGLPNNSLRTLIGCGCAAAIAASFNTPLAAVVFTLEVLALDYAVANLAPVLVAAVTGTVMTRLVYGSAPAFAIPVIDLAGLAGMESLLTLLFLTLLGVVVGVLAALFIQLLEFFSTWQQQAPRWRRFALAATGMAIIGSWLPETLGVGYDTVEQTIAGNHLLWGLAAITAGKIIATALCLGLGIPGGLIGPSMVIGATAGGCFYGLVIMAGGEIGDSASALFIMVGMAAMMGATLQAPLSALTALLEMGQNTQWVLPGMIGIVTACLVSRVGFGKESVFHQLLTVRGVSFETTVMHKTLREVGVMAAVDPSFELHHHRVDAESLERLLGSSVRWLLLHNGQQPIAAVLRETLVTQIMRAHPDGFPESDEAAFD
ncbi:MAG: chloride channel protein, partial [Gammaproteobacteria bacterium]